jgi:hypothetical protein
MSYAGVLDFLLHAEVRRDARRIGIAHSTIVFYEGPGCRMHLVVSQLGAVGGPLRRSIIDRTAMVLVILLFFPGPEPAFSRQPTIQISPQRRQ